TEAFIVKKILFGLIFIILMVCLAAVFSINFLNDWATKPLKIETEVIVELTPGSSIKKLSLTLMDNNLIDNDILFQAWMRLNGGYQRFQAGKYSFSGDITPKVIKDKMQRGDTYKPVALSVSIPEGFTIRQLNERLSAKKVATLDELNFLVRDQSFIKSLGISSKTLEGFIYPATYSFEVMPTAKEFYSKTVATFFEKLPKNYEDRIKLKGLSLGEAVTFASLIELETMQESEKPMISEVIWRRLKKKEALGIDAAIIYGIPNYSGDIKWSHLKDAKNLYNTRIHRGLPPTPIGSPSISSLEAVLNPTDLGYYYYMLDSSDRSKHLFSKSLNEHNANVKKYLRSID
ncbi:MAG: endolytic transglycosylase MltG, partial [Proteobacteria bacterium]|nr:endolytic transglycosylase MltG [Pseudomonadota bacterium]